MTPAQSYFDAKSTVGTVPIDCPYKIIFEGLESNFKKSLKCGGDKLRECLT